MFLNDMLSIINVTPASESMNKPPSAGVNNLFYNSHLLQKIACSGKFINKE